MRYSSLRKLTRRVRSGPRGGVCLVGSRVQEAGAGALGRKPAGPTGPRRGKAVGILNFLLLKVVDEYKYILLHLHRHLLSLPPTAWSETPFLI